MEASTFVQSRPLDPVRNDAVARTRIGLVRTVLHEPLVHFLLLGALMFAASAIISARRDDAARRIVIDDTVVRHLATLYESQMGALPTRAQLDTLIDQQIREEIQFREARRMGLDTDDEIVRRRLASKFDFLERDLAMVPDPSAADLQRYYDAHRRAFAQPATATFTHVYFSPDRGGDEAARVRADHALLTLRSARTIRAPDAGDRFPLQTDFAGVARLDVTQQFGEQTMTTSIFTGPVRQWIGPVRSGYGWHLVYVSRRDEETVPPLAEIQDKVRAAFVEAAREQVNQAQYAALARRYHVERAYAR